MILVVLPFWTSLLVRNYAWMVLLQTNGLINQAVLGLGLVSTPIRLMYNELGVAIAMCQIQIPFMVLPIYSVLKGIDKDLKSAAYTLGANEVKTFINVTFPLSLPGVGAGSVFVFILSLGFFITPALLGGPKVTMISTLIEGQVTTLNNWNFAAAISLVLLIFTFMVLAAFYKVLNLERITGKT
jgi:mannopine transport system permease protein